MDEFGKVCQTRKLRVNVGKSKVMKVSMEGTQGTVNVRLVENRMKDVDCFRF